jgi:hypothetical protein
MIPGIYRDLEFKKYLKIDAVSNGKVVAFSDNPAKSQVIKKQTPLMKFGSDFDKFLLETHLFNSGDVKTDKLIDMGRMQNSLTSGRYETARNLIEKGEKQVTLVWKHPKHGCLCKARPDILIEDLGIIVDVKTSTNVDPVGWFKTGLNAGLKPYYQPYWYMEGAKAVGLDIKEFIWVVFQTKAPWGISVIRAHKDFIYLASLEINNIIPEYLKCKKQNYFPGYPDKVVDIDPENFSWYFKSIGEKI